MKRSIAMLLTLIMVLSIVPLTAMAADHTCVEVVISDHAGHHYGGCAICGKQLTPTYHCCYTMVNGICVICGYRCPGHPDCPCEPSEPTEPEVTEPTEPEETEPTEPEETEPTEPEETEPTEPEETEPTEPEETEPTEPEETEPTEPEETEPEEPTEPAEPEEPTEPETPDDVPQTGDNGAVTLFSALMSLCLVGAVTCGVVLKKKEF